MRKKIIVAILINFISLNLNANNSITHFFRWLFKAQETYQEVSKIKEQVDAHDRDEKKIVATVDCYEEEQVPAYVPRKITVSEEEAEAMISLLWDGTISDEGKKDFLDRLESLSYQELGAQKILRCNRNNAKNQYRRLTRIWDTQKDKHFAQEVLAVLQGIYLRALVSGESE